MTIDTYSLCPCGSGKKMKFCKCKDSVGELDRVLKMVEGGQMVAALDRLNQILEEHPSAAWALAVRGRLLLDLREYSTLADNAERFVRLQPSNPIALAQKSAAQIFNGDIKQGTETLLQGLNETGQGVDSFVLDVASVLSLAQAQSRWLLTAQMYALLTMSAQGYREQSSANTMEMIHGSPGVNQLLKSPPALRERPDDVEWGERYDEAAGLLTNQRMLLAEPKLESLERQYHNEPAILTGLLLCAVWRGDVERQCELFRKLSACESLDFEERAQMLALSALVDPEERPISVATKVLVYELEDAQQFGVECDAQERFLRVPDELLKSQEESGEVPPRAGYQLLDRELPEGDGLPQAADIPNVVGTAFLFGRQTDRAPRLVVHVTDIYRPQVDELLATFPTLTETVEEVEQSEALLEVVSANMPAMQFNGSRAEAARLEQDVLRERLVERVSKVRLPLTDGKSLDETADDDAMKLQRTAVVRILENYDSLVVIAADSLGALAEHLNVDVLPRLKPSDASVEGIANHDLGRLDVSDADAEMAVYVLQRAKQVSCTPAVLAAADRLIELEPQGDMKQAKLYAYLAKVPLIREPDKAMEVLKEAKAWADANEQPDASILLAMLPQHLISGDGEGFQQCMQELTTKYREDPAVMARLQQMLVQFGLINPDGTPRGAPAPAAAAPASSGLWTPDQGAPPAGPSPAAGQGEGGSKLWVPGMD
ncbi:tetratricopeptide repeat protein [Roseimaritima ulvae]|uniref:SEC-C motif protein n=1 Tax=Roseimaritima ulvae TaxID=980254 RepID=A0A5B9R3Z3_9BACT|nr:hypothetical protein [Roseimaritima ulvae]QEG41111.1 hypothetical protein UC8_31290 [Roseimaritima ulvae]